MVGLLPPKIKWPLEFVGFVLVSFAMYYGFKYGLEYGWVEALGGAVLAFGLVGLAWFGVRFALGRLAEWLVRRTLTELQKATPQVENQ